MALIDKLLNQGSSYSSLDGKTPKAIYQDQRTNTRLTNLLSKSSLDLDGKTPKTAYKNTAPENQGGRI
jgi:hypothetical protein